MVPVIWSRLICAPPIRPRPARVRATVAFMSESPGERAAKRAEELHKRLQELQAGVPATKEFAEQAARRAMEARERAAQAFRRAARLHFDRAETLEGAAEAHENEISAGVGDAVTHRRAAEEFRERARQHRAAAEKDLLHEADERRGPSRLA